MCLELYLSSRKMLVFGLVFVFYYLKLSAGSGFQRALTLGLIFFYHFLNLGYDIKRQTEYSSGFFTELRHRSYQALLYNVILWRRFQSLTDTDISTFVCKGKCFDGIFSNQLHFMFLWLLTQLPTVHNLGFVLVDL